MLPNSVIAGKSYGPGELLQHFTSLYRKRPDARLDTLLDVGLVLRGDNTARTKDHLRVMLVDGTTYLVEEKRGSAYVGVFRATYEVGTGLTFHENLEGGWRNALSSWAEAERVPLAEGTV